MLSNYFVILLSCIAYSLYYTAVVYGPIIKIEVKVQTHDEYQITSEET